MACINILNVRKTARFKASSSTPFVPPKIGLSIITNVVDPAALEPVQEASNDVMQALQRQQTRPTDVSALSTDRVSISTGQNLNRLLDEAFEELAPSSSSSSKSSAAPALPSVDQDVASPLDEAALNSLLDETLEELASSSSNSSTSSANPALFSVDQDLDSLLDEPSFEFSMVPFSSSSSTSSAIANSYSFGWPWGLYQIEELMLDIMAAPVFSLLYPQKIPDLAKSLNRLILDLNYFFKSFVDTSEDSKRWLESEEEKPFFWCTHPFGTSYFLITHLDQATDLTPHLDKAVIKEWKNYYQLSVEKLKKQHLDSYNETEFPFSEDTKSMLPMIQMAINSAQNPQMVEKMLQSAQQMQKLIENPELLQQQMQALGETSTELNQLLQSAIPFFEQLDKVLQESNNTPTVQAWLDKRMKDPTYPHQFYQVKCLVKLSSLIPSSVEIAPLVKTYTSCCERLTTLGLQNYVNEGPSERNLEEYKEIRAHAASCLSTLSSLSKELKKLTPDSNA
ncbi:MAG TPA: hypothetical protein VFU89_00105, partial [Rhabdochlamydiaceae bacterium]|nr:hypothetical protein [Rhabdochlamydiaceae bacterium]